MRLLLIDEKTVILQMASKRGGRRTHTEVTLAMGSIMPSTVYLLKDSHTVDVRARLCGRVVDDESIDGPADCSTLFRVAV